MTSTGAKCRLGAVASVVALLVPAAVASAEPSSSLRTHVARRQLSSAMPTAETTKGRLRAGLVAAGAPKPILDAQDRATGAAGGERLASGLAVPAGDFDGDGLADVLEQRFRPPPDNLASATLLVVGRSGATGARLWTSQFVVGEGYAGAVPARVGAAGMAGVIVVSFDSVDAFAAVPGGEALELKLTALTGRGATAWRRTLVGAAAGSVAAFVSAGAPSDFALFDAVGGRATDVLVSVVDGTESPLGATNRTQISVVNGDDGAMTTSGSPYLTEEELPRISALPDVSGDGRDDYLVVEPGTQRTILTARRGTDGARLWQASDLDLDGDPVVASLGDVTGDRRTDLAFSENFQFTEAERPPGDDDPNAMVGPPRGRQRTVVVDGARGSVIMRAQGRAFRLGDLGRDGRADIGIVHTADDRTLGATVAAYDGRGRRRYTRTFGFALSRYRRASGDVRAEPMGDANADGIVDVVIDVDMQSSTRGVGRTHGVTSGRTAAWVNRRRPGDVLGASLDGRGADTARLTFLPKGLLEAFAYDGATGRVRWHVRLPTGSDANRMMLTPVAVSVSRDRCSDVLVNAFGREEGYFGILSGASGRLLWDVRYGATSLDDRARRAPRLAGRCPA